MLQERYFTNNLFKLRRSYHICFEGHLLFEKLHHSITQRRDLS